MHQGDGPVKHAQPRNIVWASPQGGFGPNYPNL